MLAPGNRAARQGGFTLLELLLVVAIIAMASAGVAFALRDIGQTDLEREAQRLVAALESARSVSRNSGAPVFWHVTGQGFGFIGLPAAGAPGKDAAADPLKLKDEMAWLVPGISVRGNAVLSLGPEPIIARQEVVLLRGDRALRIATDGLRAFSVQTTQAAPALVP